MSKLFALLFCSVLLASASTVRNMDDNKSTIDNAAAALQNLLEDSQANLADLEANWAIRKPILESIIVDAEVRLSAKQEECSGLDTVLAGHQKELDDARKFVAWLHKRIDENTERIATILSERCQQNTNFIESLKNDKIALRLVEFLRVQIQNKESFDFAQRKAFNAKLKSFLEVYARGNLNELIQLEKQVAADYEVSTNTEVKGRSDSEIGSNHVDNDKEELNLEHFQNGARKSWSDVRTELLQILTQLEQTIQDKMKQGQEDEIHASTTAAEYKLKLEHEIEVYQAELEKWNATVSRLEATVAQDQANVDQCRSEEVAIKTQLETARKDLETATAEFEHKKHNFEDEIQIFHEVIELYHTSTGSNADDFKSRADDYIEDGDFDNGDYNNREVPTFETLNN